MSIIHSKVIGFIAITSRIDVICVEHDACLVAGSEEAMNKYMIEMERPKETPVSIKKARFGDIINGMKLGSRYGFDKESYSRFFPLGTQIGLQLVNADFNEENAKKFFTVAIDNKQTRNN